MLKFFLISWLLKLYLYFVLVTSRVILNVSDKAAAELEKPKNAVFLSMWHGKIFTMPKLIYRMAKTSNTKIIAVTSTHRDGQYVESFLKRFGIDAIRGSSNTGGYAALSKVINAIKAGDVIAITPDGPRGPRHACNGNIHNIAAKYRVPIIPLCYCASRAKVLNTWDRFLLPLPFCKIYVDMGEPIYFNTLESEDNRKKKLIKIMKEQEENVEQKAKISAV